MVNRLEKLADARKKIDDNVVNYEAYDCATSIEAVRETLKKYPELKREYSWFIKEHNLSSTIKRN
jgi:hypothetical protein